MTQRIHELCRLVEAAERDGDLTRLYVAAANLQGQAIAELAWQQAGQPYPEPEPRKESHAEDS